MAIRSGERITIRQRRHGKDHYVVLVVDKPPQDIDIIESRPGS